MCAGMRFQFLLDGLGCCNGGQGVLMLGRMIQHGPPPPDEEG